MIMPGAKPTIAAEPVNMFFRCFDCDVVWRGEETDNTCWVCEESVDAKHETAWWLLTPPPRYFAQGQGRQDEHETGTQA